MTTPALDSVTEFLSEWRDDSDDALEKLTPLVYDELRRIAHQQMRRERPGHTLQTTALVNEAYLRLAGENKIKWANRQHFLAVMTRVMRHILTDHARRRAYAKRGGAAQQVSLAENDVMSPERAADLVALDDALGELAKVDQRKSAVVELRYFGGLSLEETASVLGISLMTVRRDWRVAKAWLFRRISNDANDS